MRPQRFILLLLLAGFALATEEARAVLNATDNASSLDPSSIKAQPPSCDDICPMLTGSSGCSDGESVGSASDVKQSTFQNCTAGLNGGSWSSSDDVDCASRGFPTDVSAVPTSSPAPLVGPSGTPAGNCNVPVLASDAGSCKTANTKALKCMLHGSQLEAQCLAYEAIGGAALQELPVLSLDIVAAAACTWECVETLGASQGGNVPKTPDAPEPDGVLDNPTAGEGDLAPGAATEGAPGTVPESTPNLFTPPDASPPPDLVPPSAVVQQRNPYLNKLVRVDAKLPPMPFQLYLTLAAAGVLSNPAHASFAGGACQIAGMAAGVGEMVAVITMSSGPVGSAISGIMAGLGILNNAVSVVKDGIGNMSATQACMSAVIFAITAGVRAANWADYNGHLKSEACNSVQSLWSSSVAQGTGAGSTGTSQNPAQFLFNPQTGQVTAGGPNGPGTGPGSVTPGGSTPPPSSSNPCPAGSCSVPPTMSSATDGGLLKNSGLGQAFGPKAGQIAPNLATTLSSGIGPTLAALMGPHIGGAGPAFAGLAQAAQDDAASIKAKVNLNSPAAGFASAGGGNPGSGGASAPASKTTNPFAAVAAAGAKAAGRAPASSAFGPGPATDIWHTGATRNIFEIVSGKIEKVSSRVGSN